MQLDWITILAQIANFLLLIWFLQRFLYKPITNAMAQREHRIEERLSDARKAREIAEQEAKALRDQQQALEADKAALLAAAHQEADELEKQLEAAVREEVSRKRSAWLAHLEDEHDETLQSLEKKMAQHVVETVRHILADFADTDLQSQIATEFIQRLQALTKEDRARLADAARSSGEEALIESGVDLPTAARGKITRALHDHLKQDIKVRYQVDADLLLGVRMTLGGQTVEWSAGRHLEKLGDMLHELLESHGAETAGQ